MPPKDKPKDKGKKKSLKDKKKDEEILKTSRNLKDLLSVYESECKIDNSSPHVELKKYIKACADDGTYCTKLILDKQRRAGKLKVKLVPIISAIRNVRYLLIKEIYVWDIDVKYEDVAALAHYFEQSVYSVNYLELLDCNIDSFSIERLSRSLNACTLTTILLDYNKFGDEGCRGLCAGLAGNCTLLKLSLGYCELTAASGSYLGQLVADSAISELYLDGNNLECEGLIELIKLIVDKAEQEMIERKENQSSQDSLAAGFPLLDVKTTLSRVQEAGASQSNPVVQSVKPVASVEKKKKKRKSAKKKAPPPPPKVGPWLQKLHVMNNSIDAFGIAAKYAPVICMRLVKKWIENAADLQELDLDDNLIGELGGREVLDGLQERKQAGLSAVKLWITHRMHPDTFTKILTLGSGGIKKAKKGKKGKAGKKKL